MCSRIPAIHWEKCRDRNVSNDQTERERIVWNFKQQNASFAAQRVAAINDRLANDCVQSSGFENILNGNAFRISASKNSCGRSRSSLLRTHVEINALPSRIWRSYSLASYSQKLNPISPPVVPPAAPAMAAPLNAAIIGPAAMNGPRPGMAKAPIPATQPKAPPNMRRWHHLRRRLNRERKRFCLISGNTKDGPIEIEVIKITLVHVDHS